MEIETPSTANNTPKIVIVNGIPELQMPSPPKAHELVTVKSKLTTSNSFKNYNHTDKWTEQETKKFYRALELFGTDFSLIAQLFPNRNRMQIKNKFLKEEKTSPKKIDAIFTTKDKSAMKLLSNVSRLNKLHQSHLKIEETNDKTNFPNNIVACQDNRASLNHNPIIQESNLVSRKPRSESFASMTSIDFEIVNDLSDLFKSEPKHDKFNNKK